jgi:16S rRNA (adenine1518-N6/adenine1519-N6)-dimethyltransferase
MPLSPSDTRDLLGRLGHEPKQFLGQNFLVDGNIVRKSLELAGIGPGDTVVEIGPGLGTLTTALLETGAEVWAVEKDRNLHAHLSETLLNTQPRFHLLEGDAVQHPLAGFVATGVAGSANTRDFKVVANLPYAIATPWLDEVLSGPLPSVLVLMLQQEAAQRYAAQPGTKSFGAISIFLQSAYSIAPGHKVASGCFYPRPDVESYLLNLVRRPEPFVFAASVKKLIRACFQQRRKQIRALLRDKVPPEKAAAWLDRLTLAGLGPQARPEQIPLALWQEFPV